MTPAEQHLATQFTARIATLHARFDESGDFRWLAAADDTSRALLRLRQRVA